MRVTGLIASAALMIAAASCSSQEKGASSNVADDNAAADMTPQGPSLAARLFGGGKPMPLDIQQQAQNGAIVYITGIQAKPTETVLNVKIVNGADRDIELDWSDHKTFLAAQGQKFFLSPPVENKDLRVAAGATMEGELVFLGRLPKTNALTLVFNEGMSDSEYESTPGISVPIQVTSAAWSDDGSKKNLAA